MGEQTNTNRLGLIIAATAVLAVGGVVACVPQPDDSLNLPRRIIPGKIESRPGGLTGSFMIKAEGDFLGTQSGGACLIADLNGFKIPKPLPRKFYEGYGMPYPSYFPKSPLNCKEDWECQGVPYTSWQGYCDSKGDNRCWVRPGAPKHLCRISGRSGDAAIEAWPLDEAVNLNEFSIAGHKVAFPAPHHWRVVSCLNGRSPTGKRACSDIWDKNKMEVMGDPLLIE